MGGDFFLFFFVVSFSSNAHSLLQVRGHLALRTSLLVLSGGLWAAMTSWNIEKVFICALSSITILHVLNELFRARGGISFPSNI